MRGLWVHEKGFQYSIPKSQLNLGLRHVQLEQYCEGGLLYLLWRVVGSLGLLTLGAYSKAPRGGPGDAIGQ